MLITVTQTVSNSTATVTNYRYDGDNARYQQIDYSSGTPITTTYHNDIVGLSQALLMDDGTTQTANLFGLDLIASDDGTTTLTMLPDGLGSVRVEMQGGAVSSMTTYEPYGTMLMRTGPSGTVYGYTGEQMDAATGLTYLRARYYAPQLKIFLSKDSFLGYTNNSASQNGYTYAHANPALFTDPTGFCAEIGDDDCWSFAEYLYFKYYVSWDYLAALTLQELKELEQYELKLNATLLRPSPPNFIGDDPPYVQLLGQGESIPSGFPRYHRLSRRPFGYPQVDNATYHQVTGEYCKVGTSYSDCWHQHGILDFDHQEQIDPIQFRELEQLVYADLYNSKVLLDDSRARYDTLFWNAYEPNTEVCWNNRCFPRSDVNYFAQGAWSARIGESRTLLHATIRGWKGVMYRENPEFTTFEWADHGYYGYLEYEDEQINPVPIECRMDSNTP